MPHKANIYIYLVAIVLLSCKSQDQRRQINFVIVASIDGQNRKVQEAVGQVLFNQGIKYYTEGSVLHAVMVPDRELKRARNALLKIHGFGKAIVVVNSDGEF